jgi:S-adenosylmethionine hydrolase
MKRIVFISDCCDIAYSELRGVTLAALGNRDDITVEPIVPVEPFSIVNGNFALRLMAEAYPEGTIFSVILNPMQVRPARILGRTKFKNFLFLGANTGVFDWLLRDFGVEELYELHDPGFFPFGGKYVHAPAACKMAQGEPLSSLGNPFPQEKLVSLNLPHGTIVHVDNFGLMKFVGTLPELQEGDALEVSLNDCRIDAIWTKRMMSFDTGTWAVYPGSSFGLLELGQVRLNGAREVGAKVGDCLKITKKL